MVTFNGTTTSEKGDGAETLLKNPKAENISVPIGVMLKKTKPESKFEGSEDPDALIAEKEMKMFESKNTTITILHSSPVAAHVLVSCTNSSYYQYPQSKYDIIPIPLITNILRSKYDIIPVPLIINILRDLPSITTLELLPRRSLSVLRGVGLRKDHLIIQTRGLYLIYSQIYFKVIRGTNWPLRLNLLCHIVERYNRRIPNDGIEKLLQNMYTLPKRAPGNTMFDFHTSYISGVFEMEVNDEVYVRALLEDDIARDPTSNYLGLVKLGG
ncbi:hypothetical protein LOTGIDRAFT_171624 [Lottia gigantea]|uniref:THD domain-containing protein n=1 Tax=Lottia gigantea TaxID=225164 RepID=V4BB68_LOTGI|nr:hypothetical protein LOTGIDRAFT_171624 [Lottia gigantea]ESP03277.1 hypothetical protein LOTGIDRAFT_171624 [Lottia gigantea]